MNYYFLVSLLPSLSIGHPPLLPFEDLKDLLKFNLSNEDFVKTTTLRRIIDLYNLEALWKGKRIDSHGNYTLPNLERAVERAEGFPRYVLNFLQKFLSTEERLKHFSSLIRNYFQFEKPIKRGFLKDYLTFEEELRLVMIGFRTKALERSVTKELQYEDPDNIIVAQILAQKDAKTYEPPIEFEDLKPLFQANYENPMVLHRAICEYRFNRVDKLVEDGLFSVDRILGYIIQLIIVEQWQWLELDEDTGAAFINDLEKLEENTWQQQAK